MSPTPVELPLHTIITIDLHSVPFEKPYNITYSPYGMQVSNGKLAK